MPITPPNLDDRRYDDIVREARALIPQYCPEWTNLGDADPGMTLVQLFAWMTEMIIYRLNRVPDKTYIHFLNFIGEERRDARPALVPLTFEHRGDAHESVDMPAFSRNSTRMGETGEPLHFLTTDPLTVHRCDVTRMVAVKAGKKPMVREIPFAPHEACSKVLEFGDGSGVQVFKMDPIEHGPRAFTPFQFLYLSHDDFQRMTPNPEQPSPPGRLRIRSANESLPIGSLFKWEFWSEDGEKPWVPIVREEEEEQVLGLPEITLKANLPRMSELDHFGLPDDFAAMPEAVAGEKWWIRGTVDYERWLAHRMEEDLEITWRDDRGGEERMINNWDVRNTGRNLEFFIQDMPPIRAGWTVRFTVVDRSISAGRGAYVPRYKWTYRRGEAWEVIPPERVRYQGTSIILTGPFSEMANDGYNLRAERIETVNIRGFLKDLNVQMTWLRPIEVNLAFGPETSAAQAVPVWELPVAPFQPALTLPALVGMKFFVGSDLFENRAQTPVIIELEFGFELDGFMVEEPLDQYHMQLTYRATDSWRVVYDKAGKYNECTFADLDADEDGPLKASRRKIRLEIDPKKQLRGLHRATLSQRETCWLRLELSKSALTHQAASDQPSIPYILRVYGIKLGLKGSMGLETYEEDLPGTKVAAVEFRQENRRLTRVVTRAAGKLAEEYPFDHYIDVEDDIGVDGEESPGHTALYMQFDQPFPQAQRLATMFRVRGESYLPRGVTVDWEILEDAGNGRIRWGRLSAADEEGGGSPSFKLNASGVLAFMMPEKLKEPQEGTWIRALFRMPNGEELPALPPLTHLMLNSVNAVNLHAFRMEKFSGLGVPHQQVKLRHFPIFLHKDESDQSNILSPDRFADMRVWVIEADGQRREWRRAPGNSLLTATKDDRVFTVEPVEGQLTFGNGIRGKMVPVGNYNISVEIYHTVPGAVGNVGPMAVDSCEGFGDLISVRNILPASGGRNSESIDEIIRRAPSVLTSRDRAVTRLDFEIIAKEASGEVARAACDGKMGDDGSVNIVVLPHKRETERMPDPFLAAGLKEHVRTYLSKRCLVNVAPQVRLATFQEVDVSLALRLRPNANIVKVREQAGAWVGRFLDAYTGGIDNKGWPFGGTLYAQDFGRMVSDLPDVRHVTDVQLFEVSDGRERDFPGWEKGRGSSTLVLTERDLFVIRYVRITAAEEGDE
ncbi:MAG: baseplate J/gp47 family protein [Myxococcota bacterium]